MQCNTNWVLIYDWWLFLEELLFLLGSIDKPPVIAEAAFLQLIMRWLLSPLAFIKFLLNQFLLKSSDKDVSRELIIDSFIH